MGVYEKHGRLDGQWLDVVIVERLIPENLTNRSPALTAELAEHAEKKKRKAGSTHSPRSTPGARRQWLDAAVRRRYAARGT